MFIRKLTRSWVNKSGEYQSKTYFYWYKSKREGNKVISEFIGPATEQEYVEYVQNDKQFSKNI